MFAEERLKAVLLDIIMNKTLAFAKNNAIATVAMVAAGAGVSEITNYLTENPEAISVFSTAAQFVTGGPVLLYLQWKTNKGAYTKKKEFLWDYIKYSAASLAAGGAVYFSGRPFLQEYFLGKEIGAANSSVMADFCTLTGYAILQIPIARLTGMIKNGRKKTKNLEDIVKDISLSLDSQRQRRE